MPSSRPQLSIRDCAALAPHCVVGLVFSVASSLNSSSRAGQAANGKVCGGKLPPRSSYLHGRPLQRTMAWLTWPRINAITLLYGAPLRVHSLLSDRLRERGRVSKVRDFFVVAELCSVTRGVPHPHVRGAFLTARGWRGIRERFVREPVRCRSLFLQGHRM